MRNYEAIVIYKPLLDDAAVAQEAEKTKTLLEKSGAQNVTIHNWKKRDLCYEMKKQKQGYYYCFAFESEVSDVNSKAASELRINENVLRFQSHRIETRARKFKGSLRSGQSEGEDLI